MAENDIPPADHDLGEAFDFLDREFLQLHFGGRTYHVDATTAWVRMDYHERHLRPGGTLSGPSMMALADLGLYAVILAHIGPVGWPHDEPQLQLHEEARQQPLIAECRLLKLSASRSARRRSIPREATISFATRRELFDPRP